MSKYNYCISVIYRVLAEGTVNSTSNYLPVRGEKRIGVMCDAVSLRLLKIG